MMWSALTDGTRRFLGGNGDWSGAAREAAQCVGFLEDVEDELVADETRSCYNCRYRRWTESSFICLRPGG
jgi:hypothetical protein